MPVPDLSTFMVFNLSLFGFMRLYAGRYGMVLLALLLSLSVFGQRPATSELLPEQKRAFELFDKEMYGAAREAFDRVIERNNTPGDPVRISAKYYKALCAVKLFHKDAGQQLRDFVREHPDSPWLPNAYFQLGRFAYRNRDNDQAVHWFEKADKSKLEAEERAESAFKKGYAHFREERFDPAWDAFYTIKDQESDYYAPVNYYYGHIAYKRGKYQTALESFKRVRDHASFGKVVPYYLTQIYYLQDKYEKLVQYAPPLLDSSGTRRTAEIARLIGEAFYHMDRFEKAIPYLDQYRRKSRRKFTREDRYQLGFAYYKAGRMDEAIDNLKEVAGRSDSLGQTAYYHLADAYLKKDRKELAQSAFHAASESAYDTDIQKDALFRYATLAYELSYDPQQKAIEAFRTFIDKYPEAPRIEDAHEYLLQLYMTTKNYSSALASLEELENPNTRMRSAHQMVAFNRGIELFQNKAYSKAIKRFKRSRKYPQKNELVAKSKYWQAESYYRIGRYQKALNTYKALRRTGGAFTLSVYRRSYYGSGYAHFQQEEYEKAAEFFRKYVDADGNKAQKRVADAYLRTGDCFYAQKKYRRAIDFYREGVDAGALDKGHGLFQMALCKGLIRKYDDKIELLKELVNEEKDLHYIPDGLYHLGQTYLVKKENDEKAFTYFKKVTEQYPKSSYARKALLSMGLIHQREGSDEKALNVYKKVVDNYGDFKAAREALSQIESIHVNNGEMEKYNRYVQQLDHIDISKQDLDAANYESAEKLYLDGKYDRAIDAFKKYLDQFEPANFALNAHFYKARAHLKQNQKEKALEDLETIASRPVNKFTEPALRNASTIRYQQGDMERALEHYLALEEVASREENTRKAIIGQMRCYHQLGKAEKALTYSRKVRAGEKVSRPVKIEAMLIQGKSHKTLGDTAKALATFATAKDTTSSKLAAEAHYRFARIHHEQGRYKRSKEAVFSLVDKHPGHKKWTIKALILLADNYRELNDLFQAKETLKDIIEHHDDQKVLKRVRKKLEEIKALERKKEEKAEQKKEMEKMENELEGFEVEDPREQEAYKKLYEAPEDRDKKGSGKKQDTSATGENGKGGSQ